MILSFSLSDIVTVPFGYLLDVLYQLTNNYGWALVLFAVALKLILYPVTAKSKKSMMKMSRMTPRLQALQKKYEGDPQKQNEAMRALYKEEGVSMGGGCLWSLVPILILIPLYSVVRQPISYMLHESSETITAIIEQLKALSPDSFTAAGGYYDQMVAAPLIPQFAEKLKEILPSLSSATLEGVKFSFLGIDLGATPVLNIFKYETYNWGNIGLFLLPILSAGINVLSMFISNRMNNSLVTDERGLQDKETAKKSQSNKSGKMMMWMMPIMTLWIGYSMPGAMSLYWFIQGVASLLIDIYLTKKYRAIYDAEDAERLRKALELEAIEAEKERVRAERRAANPDGITENTSKKKLQQRQQREQEAAKAAAAKEYAAKKGIATDGNAPESAPSGNPDRPFSKGRAYDPNRYSAPTTEEE
jgi:YidC/Oxa1 family membrane protein insertase